MGQQLKRIAVINDGTLIMLDERHMLQRVPIMTPTTGHALLNLAHEHHIDSFWILPACRTSRWAAGYPQDFTGFGAVYDGRASQDDEGRIRAMHLWYKNGTPEDRRTIAVQFPEHDPRWGWETIASSPDLLYAVLYLRNALGCEIEWGPGSVGRALMEDLNKGPRANWMRRADVSMLPPRAIAQVLTWKSLPDTLPEGKLWFHAYDKNSAFLGSCTSANLGEGDPEFVGERILKPGHALHNLALPGLWKVGIKESSSPYYLPGIQWLWTPELEFLRRTEQAQTEILCAYIWPTYHQALRSWGEHIWKARQALKEGDPRYPAAGEAAYNAVKRIATQSLGLLASKQLKERKSSWYRPDWWHLIVSNARAKIMYKAWGFARRGLAPCWINSDELGFLSQDPNPRTAIPGMFDRENMLGGFKHSYTLSVTSELLGQLRDAHHNDCHDYLLERAEQEEAHGSFSGCNTPILP